MTDHVTYIEGPDSAGHWSWHCAQNDAEASGYETAAEVLDGANQHGPLAADSLIPEDDDEF